MSLELKSVKCLEWCTKLPGYYRNSRNFVGLEVQSPVFLLKGSECLFNFVLERYANYNRYILFAELKKLGLKWKPCDVLVQIGLQTELKLSVDQTTFTLTKREIKKVWSMDVNDLHKKMGSDDYMKFRFCFKDVNVHELFWIDQKKMEHKSFQTGSYLNSNASVESLTEDFSKLLDKGSYHDAKIKCGEHCLNVHKAVLCARSEVFKTMLESDFLEGETGDVEIQDMDACCFREFLLYLYTGAMPELTYEKAKTLYEAGDKYAVRSLMLRCSEYLQDNLSRENIFECYVLGDAHSDQQLKDQIKTYLLDEKVYLEEEYWALICEKFPKMAAQVCSLSHRKRKFEEE